MSPEETSQISQRRSQKVTNNPYEWGNRQYWFERELTAFPFVELDWEFLKKKEIREKLIVGVSVLGKGWILGKICKGIVERLGEECVVFPGGHDGFKTDAQEFAVVLEKCLIE